MRIDNRSHEKTIALMDGSGVLHEVIITVKGEAFGDTIHVDWFPRDAALTVRLSAPSDSLELARIE